MNGADHDLQYASLSAGKQGDQICTGAKMRTKDKVIADHCMLVRSRRAIDQHVSAARCGRDKE